MAHGIIQLLKQVVQGVEVQYRVVEQLQVEQEIQVDIHQLKVMQEVRHITNLEQVGVVVQVELAVLITHLVLWDTVELVKIIS